jgi:3-hydroxyanthranilate 3,4-dioxygenase
MMDSPVLWEDLETGDYLYIPKATPHRIETSELAVHLRYKANSPQLEGVAWFCDGCDHEVWRMEFDLTAELPQEGYLRACDTFNSDEELRTCANCGVVHKQADLTGIRWSETAARIRGAAEEEEDEEVEE